MKRLIVIRFALTAPISARWVPLAAVESTGRGQTNSQWNTMGDGETGWLTTSNDGGGSGPPRG